jgi:hypothetical protein
MAVESDKTSYTGELIEVFSHNIDVVDDLLAEIANLDSKAKKTKKEELLYAQLLKITRSVLDNNKRLQKVIVGLQKEGR